MNRTHGLEFESASVYSTLIYSFEKKTQLKHFNTKCIQINGTYVYSDPLKIIDHIFLLPFYFTFRTIVMGIL